MAVNMLEQSFTGRYETKQLVDGVVDASFEAVVSTMGPNSELALIIETNHPVVTKDGVRVAKALDFNDIRKNMIASLITSAAIKTDELVGDGTTTTVFMVNKLYHKFKNILNFTSVRYLDDLIKTAINRISEMVEEITPDDENFKRMIYTTANYQTDIADKIIQLFQDYKSPKVQLRRGVGHVEDVIEVQQDIHFEGKYASPHLQPVTPRGIIELNDIKVILLDNQVNTITLEHCHELINGCIDNNTQKTTPIVIMARSFEPVVINELVAVNARINTLMSNSSDRQMLYIIPVCLNVAGIAGGNVLKDLSRLLNTTVFSNFPSPEAFREHLNKQIEKINLDMKGVYFNKSEPLYNQRANAILNELEPVFNEMTITERANILGKLLQTRIGRLRAENVIITVSGMTDAEISERLYLFEDAVRVGETSLRFGVIPGIGYGYNTAAEYIYNDIYTPLAVKEEHTLSAKEISERDISLMFCEVLVSQYEYLTDEEYVFYEENTYIDLVRGTVSTKPEYVFDNGCAAICALEAAWSVAKRLIKLSVILGKSNSSYKI